MSIDPSKYSAKGSQIEAMINNANRMAEDAIKSGVDPNRLNQFMSGIEGSLQAKDLNGLKSNYASFDDSIRSEISQKQKGDSINAAVTKMNSVFDSAKIAGVPIDPEKVDQVSKLINSGNPEQASTLLSEMSKPIADAIKLKNDTYMKLSQEANKSYSELKPYQRQEYEMSKNIGFASKMLEPESLKDPSTNLRLIEEGKQRDASKQMAREVFSRLQTAQEIRDNPEYMAEFGDSPTTNFLQSSFGSTDQGEFEAKLAKLKGGDLAKAMQDIKEKAGTAAGMAEKESSALQASISELGEKLGPNAAKEALNRVIKDAEYTLTRLGVDPALTAPDQVKAVRNNEVPFILADERAFNALPDDVKKQMIPNWAPSSTSKKLTSEEEDAVKKQEKEKQDAIEATKKFNAQLGL
jgi:hypothetical protein